jgi:Protein of unknown function (DUF1501)
MSMLETMFSRRGAMQLATTVTVSGWLGRLAHAATNDPQRKRACILLWMNGGPATIDLWDLKPDHANGGQFKPIKTAANAIQISEHLPKLATHANRMAILRGMSTKEGDHGRATYLLRTGVLPQGAIEYPTLGALVAKELQRPGVDLPPFVSVSPQRGLAQNAYGSGFLGPQYSPLIVADGQSARGGDGTTVDGMLKVQNLDRFGGVSATQAESRLALMGDLEHEFRTSRSGISTASHKSAYEAAVRMMKPDIAKAFNLGDEKPELREQYGRNLFGQGCLLARRLVERGVPFVEVTLDGWDTHSQNFDAVKTLSGLLDSAWATLMTDLKDRGLLDSTLIVCMGEFGRTPRINPQRGRDHFEKAWATVLAGGGITGGQVVGRTSKDGTTVEERPTSVPDLLATICGALGIDAAKQNLSNVGRPIRIVEQSAKPVTEVLA